ncbi:MAG: sodium:solute symporter [Pseudomonadales bacterium]
MDIYTTAIVISIIAYIAIGNYAGRSIKRIDDYYVAGRRAPTLLIVGTLIASALSTNAFLGETGFVYSGQAGPYLLFPPTAAIGYVFGALFFGRYLRRSRALTVADYFGQRFRSQRVQTTAGITIILALGGYLLAVTQGAAVILSELTGISYHQGLFLSWASYTLFTMYAGSKGVVLTDTIMFLLFTGAAFFALLYMVDAQGGWAASVTGLAQIEEKPNLLSWHGEVGPGTAWESPRDYLIWTLIIDFSWGVVYAVSPWQSSRHLMARNEHVVLRASIFACVAMILVQIFLYAGAAVINLTATDITPPEHTMIWAAKNLMPEFLGALLLAGIMAAALSSASTFLSLIGFSANNDIVKRKETDETKLLRTSRYSMLGIGFIALLISLFFPPSIFWLTYFVGTVFASSWGPVALMSVWSSKITADGAFWGITTGFLANVIPKFFDYIEWIDLPSYLDPLLVGGVVSLVVTLLVSSLGKVSSEEHDYRRRLHQTPDEERDKKKVNTTVWIGFSLFAWGALMPLAYYHYYVYPYQVARDQLLANGGVDWQAGEALILWLTPIWMFITGFVLIKMVRKSYGPVGGGN